MISGVTMRINIDEYLMNALKEDITQEDVSTNAVMPEPKQGEVNLICKQDGVICGLEVFVVHGEDAVCEAFTSCLKDEYKFKARAPYSGDVFDLIAGEWTEWGSRERIQKKPKQSSAYIRLLTASERLKSVIEHNEGGTNKDLGKFADQIIALCDKWER